jgi:hypothetical protein
VNGEEEVLGPVLVVGFGFAPWLLQRVLFGRERGGDELLLQPSRVGEEGVGGVDRR